MAGKLLIVCFLMAMVTLATCKPRVNPFAKFFRRGRPGIFINVSEINSVFVLGNVIIIRMIKRILIFR